MQKILNDVYKFLDEYLFPEKAKESIIFSLNKIIESDGKTTLINIIDNYKKSCDIDCDKIEEDIAFISKTSNVNKFECNLAVFSCLVGQLKKHYEKAGYPDDIYSETVRGMLYKMNECYELYGIYGANNSLGFAIYFSLKRFGIEGLQFEVIDFNRTATINGVTLLPTDKVINIHIPKSGKPFTAELRKKAYIRAKEFFKDYFVGQSKVPFFCHSWLMFKKHREMLKPTSNLIAFMNEFEIFAEYEFNDYEETSRVFNKPFTSVDKMPTETSMQRAYVELIKRGEKTGGSEGVFFL